MAEVDQLVRERARALGFDRIGVASAAESAEPEFSRYEAFIDAGKHGKMAYLAGAREARRRLDTDAILEGARSVICVAESYAGPDLGESETGLARHIAKYARGSDYHNHLRRRLRRLAAFVRTLGEATAARPISDDAPVLERAWAVRAGLGFVGKNGLLIAPGVGSFVLLGEVVTTLALVPDTPMGERCGSCSLCVDACPTAAFDAPFVLDPRRCISYLTIELRGEMPEPLRAGVGEHLFGCDVCQDVCPYNRRPTEQKKPRYAPLPRWRETSLESLTSLDEATFRSLAEGSPLKRATREGLARNAVTVLANQRDVRHRPTLEALASEHPDEAVRAHAAWGLARLDE
ncbi:MAG TPA: tRNA epoxyqueuosine(34) reductase QueG [Polyangiaceae bacterium]|nr:tRNA epoxyqueuosine(34) reductase QueG [Polyangiaceae bacterium]